MESFELMAEPIRRRLIEILASGTHDAGNLEALITREFGVSRAAVHHHLKILREHDVVRDIERELIHLAELYAARIGGRFPGDPALSVRVSKRGYRGLRRDPDDPWRRAADERARLDP